MNDKKHCRDCAYCHRAWIASTDALHVVLACNRDNVVVDPNAKACESIKVMEYK